MCRRTAPLTLWPPTLSKVQSTASSLPLGPRRLGTSGMAHDRVAGQRPAPLLSWSIVAKVIPCWSTTAASSRVTRIAGLPPTPTVSDAGGETLMASEGERAGGHRQQHQLVLFGNTRLLPASVTINGKLMEYGQWILPTPIAGTLPRLPLHPLLLLIYC